MDVNPVGGYGSDMSTPNLPIDRDTLTNVIEVVALDHGTRVGHRRLADLQAAAVLKLLADLGVRVPDPVGICEIADRAGVSRSAVEKWREREHLEFPDPEWWIGGRAAWDWATILVWGRATGRVRDGDVWARPGQMVTPAPDTYAEGVHEAAATWRAAHPGLT